MQALFACEDVLQAENPGLYLTPVVAEREPDRQNLDHEGDESEEP
jgi:hypothetical protein